MHTVHFESAEVHVPTGTLLVEAASQAGIEIQQPCGGQGRCGRCVVMVNAGSVRRRSTLRLSSADIEAGYALACQTVIEGDAAVTVPPQEQIERRLTNDLNAREIPVPAGYNPLEVQPIRRLNLQLTPPTMDDQTDDWSRLQTAIRQQTGLDSLKISLPVLQKMGTVLREGGWQVEVLLDTDAARIIDLKAGCPAENTPLWGLAVDIGTTTVTVWLVNLLTGEVKAQVAEYNGQIARGEDVISRIIYSSKNNGGAELRHLILNTINTLIQTACKRASLTAHDILKAVVAGNSTMIHLLLGIPAQSIRLSPFVTAVNMIPGLTAQEVGLEIHPEAAIDCLPGVASYVGADISAGVLASGLEETDAVTLFIDIGTNGEIVMGSKEWLVTCACSACPAFEGSGVLHGMRATKGAIEEVWINTNTYQPTYRVIGNVHPRGICGSGLISLLAEMFLTGVIDKGGNLNLSLPHVRMGSHGAEYVIAAAEETAHQQDIVITRVDIDNLLRAKAAIYAGFTVLAERVGIPLEAVEQVLVGGAFGKYINVEKAVEIGLLPDMAWEQFHFLGNTSLKGAYLALLDRRARAQIQQIAGRMTYIELSADNSFYEAFTSALFLPHTDLTKFPSVKVR
ncbi:MAG: ASKHA domain-containing protein [Anaerolineae bacterium]|nr:ASKHA domain-containing protein [Anaerolineae bacterium]